MRSEDAGEDETPKMRAVTQTRATDHDPREDGFNSSAVEVRPDNAVQMSAIARERFQLEAMISQARLFPRDEFQQFQQMVTAAKRPTFAATAEYRFQRGGKAVVGVSVKAARPLALYWKYVRFGWTITRFDEEGFGLRGFAHDLQNGALRESDAEGRWLQQRKNRDTGRTEWTAVTDERDRRELMGKAGAIVERNCILAVIPPDVVEDFIAECRKTNAAVAKGDLTKSRQQTIRALAAAMGEFGVSSSMLEEFLGHPLEQLNEKELAELRTIHNSLREGEAVGTFFQTGPRRDVTTVGTIDLSKARAGVASDPPGGTTIQPSEKPKPQEKPAAAAGAKPAKQADLLDNTPPSSARD